jgi:hypothetical protein
VIVVDVVDIADFSTSQKRQACNVRLEKRFAGSNGVHELARSGRMRCRMMAVQSATGKYDQAECDYRMGIAGGCG